MLKIKDILQIGKETILLESTNLLSLSTRLDSNFTDVINLVLHSKGRIVVTGIGKSAIIGQKIVATLNSTGTPSLFMHAADAVHGDLGMIQNDDVIICISKSGNSPEIKALIPLLLRGENKLVGIVGNLDSYLAEHSHYVLDTTVDREACPNNLAPTTSTVSQMAMGDALAVALIECRDFKSNDFAKYHPGGSLGRKLYLTLADIAKDNMLPTVKMETSLTNCLLAMSKGRMGAVVVEKEMITQGIITDGDLRRMLAKNNDLTNISAKDIMSPKPISLASNTLAIDGVTFIQKNKINHIILVKDNTLFGMVHIQDLVKEGLI